MRRPSVSVAERNEAVLKRIRQLKGEHPFWGYRHVWAQLRLVEGFPINKKRVYRLMHVHGLLVPRNAAARASRVATRSKPRPDRPRQWWGIDMTKVLTESGWVYVVVVLDWYTKQVVGYQAGSRSTSADWLVALEQGLDHHFPQGVRDQGLHLMSDNGSQPTSKRFLKACRTLDIAQAFTSYNNPKGNADTERMMRTLKEELVWLREWPTEGEFVQALDHWVAWYNEHHLHSALGYQTPNQKERTYNQTMRTLLQSA